MELLLTGLSSLKTSAIDNWIGPVFFIVVAGVTITLIVKKEIRALMIFLVVALLASVLIFAGDSLFGKNAALTKAGRDIATKVGN